MKPVIRVLLVEDSPTDVLLLREALGRDLSNDYQILIAERMEQGLQFLFSVPIDAIVLDLGLPDSQGLASFNQIHHCAPGVPVLVLSGMFDEQVAIQAVQAGAQDYLVKGQPAFHALPRAVRYAIERQQARQALLASEERFRLLVERSADGIALLDASGAIRYQSPASLPILGFAPHELQGANAFSYIHPDDLPVLRGGFEGLLARPGEALTTETRLRRRGDTWCWVELTATNLLAEPAVQAVVVNYREITERRMADEALRQRLALQEQLAKIAATVPGMICSFRMRPDGSTCMPYTSPALDDLYGLPAEELAKDTARLMAMLHPDDLPVVVSAIEESARRMTPWRSEFRISHPVRGEVWIEGHSMPQREPDGGILWHGFVQDITERKQAEQLLRLQIQENLKRKQELEAIVLVSSAMRQAETLDDMLELLTRQSLQVMGAQGSAIALLDGARLVFQAAAGGCSAWQGISLELDASLFWQVTTRGIAHFELPEPGAQPPAFLAPLEARSPGLSAGIFIPLKSGEAEIGLLFIGYDGLDEFSAAQHNLAAAIADMAGNALHRMAIAGSLQKMVTDRTRELETIYEVTAVSSQGSNLFQALQMALDPILQSASSQIAAILLLDGEGAWLRLSAEKGLPSPVRARLERLDVQGSLEQPIIEEKRPVILDDLSLDPHGIPVKRTRGPIPFAALPMLVGDRVVGVLEIARLGGLPFSPSELTLLSFIADHLGLVVENATLLRKAEQHAILEERSRMARDLHDSVTQMLYSAALYAEGSQRLIDQGSPDLLREKLGDLSRITQQALREMRLMVYELRSPGLRSEGLARAIQHRLDGVEARAGIQTSLQAQPLPPLSPSVEEALYRVAIEALNNALKHANASQVSVAVRRQGSRIVLTVSDNGKGFVLEQALEHGGMGLASMQERAGRLKGELCIRSQLGAGSEIEISLPFKSARVSDRRKTRNIP